MDFIVNGLMRRKKHRLDYDIIGLSYYPYWHENLTKLEENLQDISQRYDKQVLVQNVVWVHP